MTDPWKPWERYAYGIPMTVGALYGMFVGVGAYLGGLSALALTGGDCSRITDQATFAVGTTIGVWTFCSPALVFAPFETWKAIAAIGAIAFVCSALYCPRTQRKPTTT